MEKTLEIKALAELRGGPAIRALRAAHDITQEELGRKLGIHPQTMGDLELSRLPIGEAGYDELERAASMGIAEIVANRRAHLENDGD